MGDVTEKLKITPTTLIILSAPSAFFSLVMWVAAKSTIIFIAPFFVWAVAILVIVAAVVVTLTFCAWRFQWIGLKFAELSRDRTLTQNAGRQSDLEFDSAKDRRDQESRMIDAALTQIERGAIHPARLGDGLTFSSFPASIVNQALQGIPPLDDSPVTMNFETIARKALASRGAGRFILYGGADSGKTTLARHLISYAMFEIVQQRGGEVYIVDPHAPKVIWSKAGRGLRVIGGGQDYASIRVFLDRVKANIQQRYADGCGDDSKPLPEPHRPMLIICEEWTGVIARLKADKQWDITDNQAFYMDARKAGIGYLLVAHEKTTFALGLERMGGLLNGVEYFITLDKNAITDEHSAILGTSFKDKNPYSLITPGPFQGQEFYTPEQAETERAKTGKYLMLAAQSIATEQPSSTILDLDVEPNPEPSDDERTIIAAVKQVEQDCGKIIWSRVTERLEWTATGPNNRRIKDVLDKWNISY